MCTGIQHIGFVKYVGLEAPLGVTGDIKGCASSAGADLWSGGAIMGMELVSR